MSLYEPPICGPERGLDCYSNPVKEVPFDLIPFRSVVAPNLAKTSIRTVLPLTLMEAAPALLENYSAWKPMRRVPLRRVQRGRLVWPYEEKMALDRAVKQTRESTGFGKVCDEFVDSCPPEYDYEGKSASGNNICCFAREADVERTLTGALPADAQACGFPYAWDAKKNECGLDLLTLGAIGAGLVFFMAMMR